MSNVGFSNEEVFVTDDPRAGDRAQCQSCGHAMTVDYDNFRTMRWGVQYVICDECQQHGWPWRECND